MTPADVKILVVDDVQMMRVQVKDILRQCGFEKIRSAANGLDALKQLGEESAHLIVADWHMAPMSGLELLREVRAKEAFKDIAFLMLTAEVTKERVIEAVKAGVDEYVVKPFTIDHTQLKVMSVLLKRKVL